MKNRYLLLIAISLLSGCAKTDNLYGPNQYNSPVFDENYYVDYDGLDNSELPNSEVVANFTVDNKSTKFIYDSTMIEEYSGFNKGVLSKLYDGRTECGGLYQLSRVQLNNSGFGTVLPCEISNVSSFNFAARGGTNSPTPLGQILKFNFEITLFTKTESITYKLNEVELPTDYGQKGKTTHLVSFNLANEVNVVGYTMKFECVNTPSGYITNYKENTNDYHLAVMLYEVYLNSNKKIDN